MWIGCKALLLQNYTHWTMVPWWEKIALEKWVSNNEIIFSLKNVPSSIMPGHYILLISSEKSGNSRPSLRLFQNLIQWAFSLHFSQGCSHKMEASIKLLDNADWENLPLTLYTLPRRKWIKEPDWRKKICDLVHCFYSVYFPYIHYITIQTFPLLWWRKCDIFIMKCKLFHPWP